MSRFSTSLFAVGLFLAGVTPALAQSGKYETRFDDSSGWSFSGNTGNVGWNVDSTPSSMPGGAAHTATKSLNYNNGYTYSTGDKPNSGTTISPVVNLVILHNPTLTFWCNFQTEPGSESAQHPGDVREITLTPRTGSPVTYRFGVTGANPLVGACQAMGTWHLHKIDLQSEWGAITVTFKFDTVNGSANVYKGWFIDDLKVDGYCGPTEVHTPVKVWNFDTATPLLDGWEVQNSDAYVRWNADPSPASVAGSGSYFSPPNSLNYNNGANCKSYVYPANGADPILAYPNNGTATSPPIDLSSLPCPRLVFQCNYQTRTFPWIDVRTIEISNNAFAGSLFKSQLTWWPNQLLGACATPGTWHTHTVKLDPTWGTIQIRFKFDTAQGAIIDYPGWFLDDVTIDAIKPVVAGWDEGDEEGPKSDGGAKNKCGGSVAQAVEPARLGWLGLLLTMIGLLASLRRIRGTERPGGGQHSDPYPPAHPPPFPHGEDLRVSGR